ncbi:MAG: hypothetical protein ABFS34_10480 [Gemmatimonadota bacterium]
MRAPGKLILMGEHAVVYGEPALVATLGLFIEVRVERSGSGSRVVLELPRLSHTETTDWRSLLGVAEEARRRWEAFAADPARVAFASPHHDACLARVALGEVARWAEELPPALVRVEGNLPSGSGFGSSAALAIGLLVACREAFALGTSDEELEAAALDVERRQHGLPSGVDGATILRGGVVWAERDAEGALVANEMNVDAGHLSRFSVYHTGRPEQSTGQIVAHVRDRIEREGAHARARLARMGAATREFRRVIESAGGSHDVVRLMRGYQADLQALGVVPTRVSELVEEVEELGGAAKISGAGALAQAGPADAGAGSLLVYHEDPSVIADWAAAGAQRVDAVLGVPGVARAT